MSELAGTQIDVAAVQRELATRLVADMDAFRETIAPELLKRPTYASLTTRDVRDVVTATGFIAQTLTACMAEDRTLCETEGRRLEVIGRQRACLGIPLEDVVQAIEDGAAAGHELLERHASGWPDPLVALQASSRMSRALLRGLQQVTAHVSRGYQHEEQQRTRDIVRDQISYVQEALEGAWTTSAAVLENGHALGYEMTPSCMLVVVLPGAIHQANTLRKTASAFSLRLPRCIVGPLHRGVSSHVPIVLPVDDLQAEYDSTLRKIERAATQANVVALVEPVYELADLPRAYQALQQHL
ncbi:MAG: hypothetical protein KY443_01095, partial [Actinobacteria bacterium]|nr:hypothetical protein [Actinomycetota bacterium]